MNGRLLVCRWRWGFKYDVAAKVAMKESAASMPTPLLLKPSTLFASGGTVVVIMLLVALTAIVINDNITAKYANSGIFRLETIFMG